jgi:hypothetical protein
LAWHHAKLDELRLMVVSALSSTEGKESLKTATAAVEAARVQEQ